MESVFKLGWRLPEDCVYNYFGDDLPNDGDSIHKALLDSDIREILNSADDPAAIAKLQSTNENGDIVSVPIILQIQKIRNASVAKAHENDPTASSRLLRITLTDGKNTLSGLEMAIIKGLDANTPPGTKIQLTNAARNERGFLILSSSNCRMLGGKVEKLIEKWRLRDSNALTRPRIGDGQSGPPPWVPFGQKPQFSDGLQATATKNLRVMDLAASGHQEAPAIPQEFNQARQQVIAQAMKQDRPKGSGHKQY